MSELINTTTASGGIRWQLLTSVAACTLLAAVTITPASAADEDRPTVWIELGGQLQRLQNSQEPFRPAFLNIQPRPNYEVISPDTPQRLPRHEISGEAKISFTPRGTDWALSAAVRYGRTNGKKHLRQQTETKRLMKTNVFANPKSLYQPFTRWGHTKAAHNQSHMLVDFAVGKDVGLGTQSQHNTSFFNLGVRFAQFSSKTTVKHSALPDPYITMVPTGALGKYKRVAHHHSYFANLNSEHSFRGVGPSLTWDGSVAIAGDFDESTIGFDWGVNGALLFGRQKVSGGFQTTSRYFNGYRGDLPPPPTVTTRNKTPLDRSRSRIVPNLGGFAGVSFSYPSAKVSFGYRADFFFGAMDGGIATRKTEDRSFHGPFAKVSIGLGG